ncbi:hypothetical protein [Modestobacter sp. SYSU DS0875]
MTESDSDPFAPYVQDVRAAQAAEEARQAALREQNRAWIEKRDRETLAAQQASIAAARRLRSAGIPQDCSLAVHWKNTFRRNRTYLFLSKDLSYSAEFDFGRAWLVQERAQNDEGSVEREWVFLRENGDLRAVSRGVFGGYSPAKGLSLAETYGSRRISPPSSKYDDYFPKLTDLELRYRETEVPTHLPHNSRLPKLLAELLHRHGLL